MVDTDQVLHAYAKDCCCARCDTWSQAYDAVTRCFSDHRNDAATVSRALGAMLDAARRGEVFNTPPGYLKTRIASQHQASLRGLGSRLPRRFGGH